MDASLYQPLFLTIIALFCAITGYRYVTSPDTHLQEEQNGWIVSLLVSLVFVFWLGMRPLSGRYFGDTNLYAYGYERTYVDFIQMDWHSEWIWQWLMIVCKWAGFDVHAFFTIVEAGYILPAYWAVKRFLPSNPWIGMLFVWSSLMFFAFGTNGLRNGLACHLVLLAISFLFDAKYVAGIILFLIAFGIHRSVMLPIIGTLVGMYLIKNPKYAIYCWIASIGISLVAGGAATSFIDSLGFDDRMTHYSESFDDYKSYFSRSGFRWDFLLYSAVPIYMTWYVCVKRQIQDKWYNALCVTYCLSNAFWVIVIRSLCSNRFAYLSWFLYPIIIVYPLVNLPLWQDQDRKIGLILFAYCGFTLFMQIIYWR
ncbi:MAG: EpsG family protein [Prevotella sp.]|nr:EpsG family protein [Prevotella sp.]